MILSILLVYVCSLYVKYFTKRFLCYCNRSPIDKEFFSRCDPPRNDFTLRMSNSLPFSPYGPVIYRAQDWLSYATIALDVGWDV